MVERKPWSLWNDNSAPRMVLDLEVSDMMDDGVAQALRFKGYQ